ncbi:hypothetical protein Esti_004032 [Eimeria stiedai]
MELPSSATSEGIDNAIHSDVRPQLSVGSGQRSSLVAEAWKGKVLCNRVVPPVNNMPTEARHYLIRTPAAQQTKPVVHEGRLEYSELSEQHQAPPARQPREEEQQIPGHVDERMSASERQPSPQQDKHPATLLAALKEVLRSVKAQSSTSNDQHSNVLPREELEQEKLVTEKFLLNDFASSNLLRTAVFAVKLLFLVVTALAVNSQPDNCGRGHILLTVEHCSPAPANSNRSLPHVQVTLA